MRSWDRVKPEKRLAPRPEQLKSTIVLDRPWPKTGKSPVKTTFTTDAISDNLQLFDSDSGNKINFSEGGED